MSAHAWIRPVFACVLASLLAGGCIVTKDDLNRRMKEFDDYLKKRDERVQAENEAGRLEISKRVDEFNEAIKSFEKILNKMKEDLEETKGKTGAAIESAAKVQPLVEEVSQALEQIRMIEGRLNRRVGDTVEKYREALLEEKRVLMERLRALNESLRNLKPEEGGEKEDGAGKEGE